MFYASATPPEFSGRVVQRFNERALQSFAKLVDVDLETIDPNLLHRLDGAAIPTL